MIKSLKFGSLGGGGGGVVKILFHPLLGGGGAKPNISFFLGDSGNRMHFCIISLASWGRNRPPNTNMCYIYGLGYHFIFSLFYLL